VCTGGMQPEFSTSGHWAQALSCHRPGFCCRCLPRQERCAVVCSRAVQLCAVGHLMRCGRQRLAAQLPAVCLCCVQHALPPQHHRSSRQLGGQPLLLPQQVTWWLTVHRSPAHMRSWRLQAHTRVSWRLLSVQQGLTTWVRQSNIRAPGKESSQCRLQQQHCPLLWGGRPHLLSSPA
jgi:hypothetical protein